MLRSTGEVGEKALNEKVLKMNFATFKVCLGVPVPCLRNGSYTKQFKLKQIT